MDAVYEFGPFRLDPSERLLLRDGHVVSLASKAFDLLFHATSARRRPRSAAARRRTDTSITSSASSSKPTISAVFVNAADELGAFLVAEAHGSYRLQRTGLSLAGAITQCRLGRFRNAFSTFNRVLNEEMGRPIAAALINVDPYNNVRKLIRTV